MTNLDTRIIYDANGKPIPQYLDVTDNTDGTAGTMKPITKNSYPEIQDVNVTNQQAFPTDYPDGAVKQELELIKAQQQQILERLDEPIPTQLTGSNVVEQQIFTRSIRTTNPEFNLSPPSGAQKLVILMNIYGVTGEFQANEGVSIALTPRTRENRSFGFLVTDKVNVGNRGVALFVGSGFGEVADWVTTPRIHISNLPMVPSYLVRFDITGTFGQGQGIDCDMSAQWYL